MPDICSARRAKRDHDHEALQAQLYQQIGPLKVEWDWVKKPSVGIVVDGQLSLRCAIAAVCPDGPHHLCHFHSLREAAQPIDEADRHAKKERKKRVRGVRLIERRLAGRSNPAAEAVRGYWAAVRSALTDDGRPPWTPRGSHSTTASARFPPVSSGSKQGGLAPGVESAAVPTCPGLGGHGGFMARRPCWGSLGPSGGPPPQPPGPARGLDGATSPRPQGHLHRRWGTSGRSPAVTGQDAFPTLRCLLCPGPILIWHSFSGRIASMNGAPRGVQWLPPAWP
jgi:hypothetical protein